MTAPVIGVIQIVGSFGAAVDQNQPDRFGPDAFAIVLLLIGPVALAFRHRWPVAAVAVTVVVTDLYLGLGYVYGPIFLSLILVVFLAIRDGHRVATWAWVGAGFVGLVGSFVWSPRISEEMGPLHFLLVAGWIGLLLTVSEIARIRRERMAERERAAAEEEERRASDERLNLAQELHDVLAHNISLMNVQASVALHLLDEQPDGVRPALAAIKDASRESLRELRTALDLLQGGQAPRSPAPRLADLDGLVAAVRASGLDVRFRNTGVPPPLSGAVEQAAYRIVQEALTNVTRHARARAASVSIGYQEGVDIEVVDDGVGGSPVPGRGITGMRRRAEALGGRLEAGPAPGGGFRVVAHLPGDHR
jgi:signal transduction histidine kinase